MKYRDCGRGCGYMTVAACTAHIPNDNGREAQWHTRVAVASRTTYNILAKARSGDDNEIMFVMKAKNRDATFKIYNNSSSWLLWVGFNVDNSNIIIMCKMLEVKKIACACSCSLCGERDHRTLLLWKRMKTIRGSRFCMLCRSNNPLLAVCLFFYG